MSDQEGGRIYLLWVLRIDAGSKNGPAPTPCPPSSSCAACSYLAYFSTFCLGRAGGPSLGTPSVSPARYLG